MEKKLLDEKKIVITTVEFEKLDTKVVKFEEMTKKIT